MPLNMLAWNYKVMINRHSWGYSYSIGRGDILGFLEDELRVLRNIPTNKVSIT
jgi:hypothetical protein